MKLVVLDASAWLRMFLPDGPIPDGLHEAAAMVDAGAGSFVAPELILIEAAHALHKKRSRGAITSVESSSLWEDMRTTPMNLIESADHVVRAMELAKQHSLSMYDGVYLAVAEHIGAPLLTADDALTRAATVMNLRKPPTSP